MEYKDIGLITQSLTCISFWEEMPVSAEEEIIHADVVSDKSRSMPNGYLQVEREAPFTDDSYFFCFKVSRI